MNKFNEIVGTILGLFLAIAIVAFFGGTIVYWIWPHVIPHIFPGLVATGMIVGKIAWWKAVLLAWLAGILFKSTGNTSK